MIMKYNHSLKNKARSLRNCQTLAERILWYKILPNDKTDYRFLRQKIV
ncbi:DUF559 domain-containing protein [Candidatus Beckwithbacteria bacterium]|nr:DUF559 domain-containing protein [Candidatus Beckwithbacteria bacterium]